MPTHRDSGLKDEPCGHYVQTAKPGVSAKEFIGAPSQVSVMAEHAATLIRALGLESKDDPHAKNRASTKSTVIGTFKERAHPITNVRNELGIGTLIEQAQSAIQIIRNDRNGQVALVMSEGVLGEVMRSQVEQLAQELGHLNEELRRGREELITERSRKNMLAMLDSMETLEGDVPIVDGSAATPDVDV